MSPKVGLYVSLFAPWPIAIYSIFAAFTTKYSILISALAVIIGTILVIYYRKKIASVIKDEVNNEYENAKKNLSSIKSDSANSSKNKTKFKFGQEFRIISVIYGIVAGIAITQAMMGFSETTCPYVGYEFEDDNTAYHKILTDIGTKTKSSPCFEDVTSLAQLPYLISNDHMMLVISFFILGTCFYHCAILFLYPKTVKFVGDQNTKLAITNCLILFTESVFLFFAATSADAIERFSLWIIMLLIFDTGWCILNFLYKDKPIDLASIKIKKEEKTEEEKGKLYKILVGEKKRLNALYLGWAHIEGLFLVFFVVTSILLTYQGDKIDDYEISLIHVTLLSMSVIAVVAIYQIGWDWFWTKYKLEDQ